MNRIRGSAIPMQDCSDKTEYCLRSTLLAISFPRSCDAFEKFISDGGSGHISVAASYMKNMHLFNMRMYLLVDDRFPHYGFLANERGIRGLVYTPLLPVKDVATSDALAAADEGNKQEFVFSELVSAVPMMQCEADT